MSESEAGKAGEFVTVEVPRCPRYPAGLAVRFKVVGPRRGIERIRYESKDGLAGVWCVSAEVDDEIAAYGTRVCAVGIEVEDPSGGTSILVRGDVLGLVLLHQETGAVAFEPYLLVDHDAVVA